MCVEAFRVRGNSPTPWGRGRPCRRVRDLLMTRCARRGVGDLGRRGGEYLDLGSPKPGARPAEPRPALPPGARPGLGRERFGPLGSRASRDALAVAGTRLGRRWLSPSPAPLPPASRAPPAPGTGRLTSSRDGDSARAPGGGGSSLGRIRRGHRSRRRRRRGHKSGGVNLGARSPQPRTHRAPAGAGGDAHLGQRSSPPVFAALAGPSDPRAPTWDRGSSRSRPEWKERRGVKVDPLLFLPARRFLCCLGWRRRGLRSRGTSHPEERQPPPRSSQRPRTAPHHRGAVSCSGGCASVPWAGRLHLTPWDSRTSDKVLRPSGSHRR
ncbi:translation initiation factor IF-2-like isoform X3 [Phocoena sinus]|uniref:translation initiation factor IF-2-like isoform X3 n=1 Tax=Phocoena sinus TaxID=42100 RepID=UPI0013C46573|nr:translation initiation factor IF-2-like isoform X3 [Phocoena sinus]XP_032480541.1 translation initiation factor IF-2-like isoform X3 [Phocoena sinus]XP_032480543.1 translation initiation factor IF-2-like isoform X3 [Phocoena sinus]